MIWKILGIEKTKDEEAIKAAYRERLRFVNPEDDEEGFKELRRAYEEALSYAAEEEVSKDETTESGVVHSGKKNEVDFWLERIDAVYLDVAARRDENKWESLLNDPICDDLDTELEAAEKLLVYFMSHTFMPQTIWKLVDKRFHYLDNYDQLKERFPENYLDYVKWQIENPSFIDFDMFDGKTDDRVDEFIAKLFEIKNVSEEEDIIRVGKLLGELKDFRLTHPFVQVEEARYLLKKAEQIQKKAGEQVTDAQKAEEEKLQREALDIMEELDFEYSDNPYIERVYAEALIANQEVDKARSVYDAMLERSPDNYVALAGQAICVFLNGDPEAAKEQVEDILEERVQDMECLALLDKINDVLVKDYEEKLKEDLSPDICYKLGWCYYQQKEFEKGIALLDRLDEREDYDYINLRCRLYLANENYGDAYPLAEKWLELIEGAEDDGSREMIKRKNRLSLAHFSIGVCIWETKYKTAEGEEKQEAFAKADMYIKKAVEEEHNLLVGMSYKEQLARFYLDAKKYTECIHICNEIIEADAGFFPAYVHRQKANYELKNAKEVVDDYYTCMEIYPAYAPPYVLAAEVFFAFDQYNDVEKVIEAAKEAGLESDSLELYRIKCLHFKDFSRKNVEQALNELKVLKAKIANRPEGEETDIEDIAELEREHAILYWDLDETDKALGIIDRFLEKNPDNAVMLHLKVDVLVREERPGEALSVCSHLVEVEPDNLYSRLKLGNCYERLDKLYKAVDHYNEILKVNPDFAPALRRMMYLYSYLSNRQSSLKYCKKAIQYASRYIEVSGAAEGYVERGNLYIDLYELEKAVEDCKKAIELDSEAYYAYNNLGCALLKLRRVDEAFKPLHKAVELDPDKDHLPYLNLAECYVLTKEYDKAIHAYEKALKLRPKAVHWKEEIADIYTKKGDFQKAISIYQSLIDEVKQRVKNMNLKGKLAFYIKSSLTEENERLYSLYCKIAEVYRQAGDTKQAEKYYSLVDSPKITKYVSCDAMGKAAEYYRDQGKLEEAGKRITTAFQKMDPAKRDTRDHRQLYFIYTTISFEKKNKRLAENYANLYLQSLLEEHGGEEKMLKDRRYRPMRLYDLAIMNICAGNLEKGREYLKQIRDCHLCVTCETCDCFEYYFGMGLIAELEGRTEEAKNMYEKAIEIKGDYPCAKRHLENLK